MKTLMVRLAGFLIFAAAFFLPAVRSMETGPGSGPYAGWSCAVFAIAVTAGIPHFLTTGGWQDKDVLGAVCLVLSGWVNPLVLIYLLLSIWKNLVRARRAVAVAILVCIAATWIFLFKGAMHPLMGHFAWIAGIMAILSPEAVAMCARGPAAGNETSQAPE